MPRHVLLSPDLPLKGLLPGADAREAVHPERFHAVRNRRDEREPATPDEDVWAEMPRGALLAGDWNGRSLHRVALTTDAGMGKTYNLRHLHHELNARPVVAFTLPVGALQSVADLITQVLVPLVRDAGNSGSDFDHVHDALVRKRDAGQIVMLFDGLDQVRDADTVDRVGALLRPNSEWAKCRMVVAGRPFSINHHWERLFRQNTQAWQFVQIGEFDEEQQRAVLGKLAAGRDRIDVIPTDAHTLFTVPRVLEYIRSLPEMSLPGLDTVAEVYRQATGHLLTTALARSDLSPKDVDRYRAVLGALAFGMYARTEVQPNPCQLRPNLDRVRAAEIPGFLIETHTRLAAAFAAHGRGSYAERQFDDDCGVLNRLNEALAHGWLDVDAVGDPSADLLWRNASLQEFFAAYWATRWGTPDDLALRRDWVVNPITGENSAFYWFWRYATEMPDKALNTEQTPRATWVKAMAPLYDQTDTRSTEFIYRSWNRMTETRQHGNAKEEHPQATFLAEFPAILTGNRGLPGHQRLAREMMAGFVSLVGSAMPGDTGTCWLGSKDDDVDADDDEKPRRQVTLTPYAMHRYCVQNQEYELFDLGHKTHRWTKEPHPLAKTRTEWEDRCPVVNVTWFDAWCFAAWCGCRLPDEAEWEYACRAGHETPYAVGDGHRLTVDVCHFDQDRGGGHTIPVDGKSANRWGLFQMHGNVREWCDSWYGRDQVYKILRGGSWHDRAKNCRASRGRRFRPRNWYHDSSIRLVRARS